MNQHEEKTASAGENEFEKDTLIRQIEEKDTLVGQLQSEKDALIKRIEHMTAQLESHHAEVRKK